MPALSTNARLSRLWLCLAPWPAGRDLVEECNGLESVSGQRTQSEWLDASRGPQVIYLNNCQRESTIHSRGNNEHVAYRDAVESPYVQGHLLGFRIDHRCVSNCFARLRLTLPNTHGLLIAPKSDLGPISQPRFEFHSDIIEALDSEDWTGGRAIALAERRDASVLYLPREF